MYDIADLYKTEVTVPAAFQAAAEGATPLEGVVRRKCRDAFVEKRLLQRIVPDIDRALGAGVREDTGVEEIDRDAAKPGWLWTPQGEETPGGVNYADEEEGGEKPRSS